MTVETRSRCKNSFFFHYHLCEWIDLSEILRKSAFTPKLHVARYSVLGSEADFF